MKIKIIPQVYETPEGIRKSYGILINDTPRLVCYSKEELDAFFRGLKHGK